MADPFFRRKNKEKRRVKRLQLSATPEELLLKEAFELDPRTSGQIRFQVAMSGYYVDFLWQTHSLVIELDGKHHRGAGRLRDAKRSAALNANGFTVIRFWNRSVKEDPKGIVDKVVDFVA